MQTDANDKSPMDKPAAGSVPPLLSATQPPAIGGPPPLAASPPPLLPKPKGKSGLRRLVVLAGRCILVGFAILLGWVIWNQATRKDTPEDYAFLCRRLFDNIQLEGITPVMLSDAEQEILIQKLRQEISRISRHGKKLAPIAREFPALFNSVEEIIANAPQGSKIVFGLAEAFLGAYTGQREHVGAGGQKALQETERGWNTYKAVEALFNQKHVIAVKMAELVPQFSGPMTNGSFVVCAFAEHRPGFLEVRTIQSLSLVNSSGRDLHNCVISARLSNAAGESYLNLYFAPDWPKDGKFVTQYVDTDIPKSTVDNVTRVDVSVWAREFSIEPITLKKPAAGWPEL